MFCRNILIKCDTFAKNIAMSKTEKLMMQLLSQTKDFNYLELKKEGLI